MGVLAAGILAGTAATAEAAVPQCNGGNGNIVTGTGNSVGNGGFGFGGCNGGSGNIVTGGGNSVGNGGFGGFFPGLGGGNGGNGNIVTGNGNNVGNAFPF